MGPSVVAPLVGLLVAVALVLQGRRNEALTLRRWCFVLTPAGRAEHDRVRRWIERRVVTSRSAYAAALELSGQAKRELLDAAIAVRLETEPRLLELLRTMARLARQLEAIQPCRPVAPSSLRTPRLALLAVVAVAVHQVLVSMLERFLFRLFVIRRGIGMSATVLLQPRSTGALDDGWRDYETLTGEALASLGVLMASASAVPVGQLPRVQGVAITRRQ